MPKKLLYMVVDTETATLPFVSCYNGDVKKKIAIAKPLVYDIGWTLMERNGNIVERKSFLISEVFSVPSVFNTAYYKEKRPLYLEDLRAGKIVLTTWDGAMEAFERDLARADFVGAFNSMFDFKKAIPFTELYVKKLYSDGYAEWEEMQTRICDEIARGERKENKKPFEPDVFRFRDNEYPLFDIWGMACEHLINRQTYKEKCLEMGMLTQSGTYFKSSAETTFRYLCKQYNFDEAHRALDDAEIESFILSKILHDHAITIGIKYFPFRELGETTDFVEAMPDSKRKRKCAQNVHAALSAYLGEYESEEGLTQYQRVILNRLKRVEALLEEKPVKGEGGNVIIIP